MKSNKLFYITAVILLSFLIVSCSNQEKEVVRIGYTPIVQGLPLYVSIEEGYFKEANIEIKTIKFDAPNQAIDSLLQNELDFSPPTLALGITGVVDFKNPGKLKIYAVPSGTIDNPAENILVPLDSNLKSISDLKGKKLGIWGGTIQWRTITRELLAQNNLEMDKDVIIIELAPGLQVQALASKQIDALLALEPMSTIALEQGAGKIMVTAPVERVIVEPFYGGAGIVTTKFATEHPELTEKLIKIMQRAMKELNENPDKYRKYLKGYTPLNEDIASKVPIPNFKSCEELNETDIEAIQKFFDIFTKHKVVDGRIDPRSLLYC